MPRHCIHGSIPPHPIARVRCPDVPDFQTVRTDRGIEDPPGAEADDTIFMERAGDVEDPLICADYHRTYLPGIGWEARGEGNVSTGLGCTKDERSWDVAALPCRCHAKIC